MKRFKILLLSSIVLASSLTPALACGNAARDYDNAVRNLIEKTEKILTLSTARDLLVDACKQLQLANGDFDKTSKQLSAVKNSSELKTTASEMRAMATSLTSISDLLDQLWSIRRYHITEGSLLNQIPVAEDSPGHSLLRSGPDFAGVCWWLSWVLPKHEA